MGSTKLTMFRSKNGLRDAKANQRLDQALAFAEQAAIHHGLRGLKLYIQLQMEIIGTMVEGEDDIQTEGENLLGLVLFAECLVPDDDDKTKSLLELTKNQLISLSALDQGQQRAAQDQCDFYREKHGMSRVDSAALNQRTLESKLQR